MSRVSTTIVFALLLASCGGAAVRSSTREPLPIDALRARAAASPDDAAIARELAAAELLWDGGDPARARAAIDHAIALSPDEPALYWLSATEHEQRGRIADAFAAELRALEVAQRSNAPLAAAIGEIAIGYASGRESDVPDWRARIEPALSHVIEEPGTLGLPARMAATWRLPPLVRRRGEPQEATAISARAGCIQHVRVAGPFGPSPMLRFDATAPAEGRGALGDHYDLGPNREEVPTRALDSRGCGFDLADTLDGELRGPGVWVIESMLEVAEGGEHVLYVHTPNVFRVSIDGERVGELDRRRETGPDGLFIPVRLTPGTHELEVVLATRHSNPFIAIALARDASSGVEIPEGGDALTTFVRVLLLKARGDVVGAREAASALRGETATALVTRADLTLVDPFLPEAQAHDVARRMLERASELDPEAWYPPYRAALAEQGARESLEELARVAERFPQIASLQLRLAAQLVERGRTAEGDALVARAREQVPTSCAALAAELAALRRGGHGDQADARVDEELACDARSRARFALFVRQRRWDDAAHEIERLTPLIDPKTARGLRVQLATAVGDEAALRRFREEIAREHGRSVDEQFPVTHTDELLAAGQRARAVEALGHAIDAHPGRTAGLRRIRRALGGDDVLYRYRVDGAEAIRRFEASGRHYDDASQLLVLDYEVVRVNDDGSAEELVHQIYRVQSEEAIERLGQLSLPGYVLTLRSIKPDGRRLEPDSIEELDHVEMPSLAIGDYVEYEYVRFHAPGATGGYRSGGWVFQNFSYPFDLSRLRLIAPPALPIVIEARGPVPEPVETHDGDLRVLTWTVEESRPLTGEPRAAVSPERLPHLDFGLNAGWEPFFDAIVDALMDDDVRDPAAERLAREILSGLESSPVEARVRRLSRWVQDNIEDGATDMPTAAQVAARAGDRNRVLVYLLGLAGIDARFVLARGLGERAPGELLRNDVYSTALVMVRRPDGPPIFTTAAERGIPFGYITPNLRGQEAVVLEPGHPRVTIDGSGSSDLRDVAVDIALAPDGSARVTVEEQFHGAGSFYWRQQLEGVPEAELSARFEQGYVVPTFGQARLVALSIDGREDVDAPIVFRYVADVAALARAAGGELLVPQLFSADLARTFAALPSRETTERILGNHTRVRMRVRGPSAMAGPNDGVIEGPAGAHIAVRSIVDGGALLVERELVIPPMLVTPDQYGAFTRFCREVDRLEATEIRARR